MAYAVTLYDFPHLENADREKAQKRYRDALERHYGDPERVAEAYRTWNTVAENDGGETSGADLLEATKFQKALERAREAGFRGLGEPQEAYFEIRLAR
jgi:general stress protein YciG